MSATKRTAKKKPTRARPEKAASPLAELALGEDSTRQFKRDVNPSDNQSARFNLAAVEAGKTWEEMEGEDGR